MGDTEMYGVFGPGDGKPVAVYADGDEAARERRKRFGDRGVVAPVTLPGMTSEQRAAVEAQTVEVAGPPARANGYETLRSQIMAELAQEAMREELKKELGGTAGEAAAAQLAEAREQAQREREAREAMEQQLAELRRESHATLTELQTGQAPAEGEEPRSAAHEFGPAPAAQGENARSVPSGPIVDQLNQGTVTTGANPSAEVTSGGIGEQLDPDKLRLADIRKIADERGVQYDAGETKAQLAEKLNAR